MLIRKANSSDFDFIKGELQEFSNFYGTRSPLFGDDGYPDIFVSTMLKDHTVFIAEKNGERLGFVSGVVSPHMFNPKVRVFYETFWWVPEKHRGTRAGLLLLEAFVNYGREHSDWLIFTLEHKSPVSDRSLLKRGFQLQERNYLLEV